jgi:hypothetical protein
MLFQGDLRYTHLPYCLRKLDDGRYITVNRRYKPLGICSRERVVYEDHPTAMYIEGLTDELAIEIDVQKGAKPGHVFLYDGTSTAPKTQQAVDEYMQRLSRIMTLKMYTSA